MGLDIWCEDEAGPFPTRPHPGINWCKISYPVRYSHEYIRQGTAKLLTLFHPKDGRVIVKGALSSKNEVIHPWMKSRISAILKKMPKKTLAQTLTIERGKWTRWQEGMKEQFTLPTRPPPLRMILIMDNLTGHKSHTLISWLYDHGVMPLFTPLGGSWLNMAESIQRILKRRGLEGQNPQTPQEIMLWLEQTAKGWNRKPTPFVWGGKRASRRMAAKKRGHHLGGSGAWIHRIFGNPTTAGPI